MANTGHHGHRTSRHRAGKLLVIKGHEVLKGAAAAHQQNTVGAGVMEAARRKPR